MSWNVLREQLRLGVPGQRTQRGIDLEIAALEVDQVHPDRCVIEGRAEALLALPQGSSTVRLLTRISTTGPRRSVPQPGLDRAPGE